MASLPAGPLRRYRQRVEREVQGKVMKAVVDAFDGAGTIEKANLIGAGGGLSAGARNALTSGHVNTSLMRRITTSLGTAFDQMPASVEASLASQGMTWAEPFSPGRPINPYLGWRVPARQRDYVPGENVQITPRWNRISFNTLQALYNSFDVAQICVQHLINDVRTLDYAWQPKKGVKADVSADIARAEAFWEYPDRRQPFKAWTAEYLQDVLRWDAGSLYLRSTRGGDLMAVEVIDGTTIIPLIDFFGRPVRDEDGTPAGEWAGSSSWAFQQIIQGMPFDSFPADDIVYQPLNPLPESSYGLCALEKVLLVANTSIRFQWHFLQYFTEGTLPAGFMKAPPDMSDPSQIASWQEVWDAFMAGDQAMLRRIRWVPAGSDFQEVQNADFNPEFPLYLMRCTCAAYGVTPNDLGFTDAVNKASAESQVDVQARIGQRPISNHLADIINLITHRRISDRITFIFEDGSEIEDLLTTAQAEAIYIEHGVLSPDEPRARLGYSIDQDRPTARFLWSARTGATPLLAIESMAGDIDAETYGPAASAKRLEQPMPLIPGTAPIQGSPEAMAADQATAQMQRDLIHQANGLEGGTGGQGEPVNAAGESQDAIDAHTKPAPPAPAEPVDPSTATVKAASAGMTASTGVYGSPLDDDEDDEDDVSPVMRKARLELSLSRWQKNSIRRVRKGRPPRPFFDEMLPIEVAAEVWVGLDGARTVAEVNAAFAALGKAAAPN